MPDFSKPGSDGVIPFGLNEWRRGVVYTVRPEILSPLASGRQFRIMSLVRRRNAESGYGTLYHRASDFVRVRAAEMRCAGPAGPLHTWIASHTWRSHEIGEHRFALAALSSGFSFPSAGDATPEGEAAPTEEALRAPGGASPEEIAQRLGPAAVIDEIFNDFDFDPNSGPGVFSYGEYVGSAEGVEFAPFVARAEHRARAWDASVRIIGREWLCATSPDLAVIHLYYESGSK